MEPCIRAHSKPNTSRSKSPTKLAHAAASSRSARRSVPLPPAATRRRRMGQALRRASGSVRPPHPPPAPLARPPPPPRAPPAAAGSAPQDRLDVPTNGGKSRLRSSWRSPLASFPSTDQVTAPEQWTRVRRAVVACTFARRLAGLMHPRIISFHRTVFSSR
jgi:hypothetical protein